MDEFSKIFSVRILMIRKFSYIFMKININHMDWLDFLGHY